MRKIEMLLLDEAQMHRVYEEEMQADFPANELKPLETMQRLREEGSYAAYGFFEEEKLLGYAFCSLSQTGKVMLLDYFAVCRPYRAAGLGGGFLKCLRQEARGRYRCIIAEVEAVDHAQDPVDAALRYRRIAFYERNGLRHSGLMSHYDGGHFIVLLLDLSAPLADLEIAGILEEIYCSYFGPERVQAGVTIEVADHSTVYNEVDYAEIIG